jgi:hypothetical protein
MELRQIDGVRDKLPPTYAPLKRITGILPLKH